MELYKEYSDKYLKNKKLEEGDFVIIETLEGSKVTVLKKTEGGKLFLEAIETKKNKDYIIVELKNMPEFQIIKIPTFEEVLSELLKQGYKIDFKSDEKKIRDKNNSVIFSSQNITNEDLIKILI